MPSSSTTPNTASTHHAKRPYAGSHSQTHTHHQPTITSFFPCASTTFTQTSVSANALPNDASTVQSSPVLPALVQSNLLSVGMRVRKSIPEGYKTGLPRKHPLGYQSDIVATAPASVAAAANNTIANSNSSLSRELAPFCGIMKVGGLAVQSWSHYSSPERDEIHVEVEEEEEEDEAEVPSECSVPFLSSQGSTISTVSTGSGIGYKRRFDDEDEEPEVVIHDIWRDPHEEEQLSPKTRLLSLTPRLELGAGKRRVAVPKSRRKGTGGRAEVIKKALLDGQENEDKGILDMDFGDAEFMDWSSCLA